jgi:hypothetical protein
MKFFFVFDINYLGNKKVFKNFSGYFCNSSFIVKELAFELDIFSSLRSGFVFLIKSLSRCPSNKKICFANIAPGLFKTKRLKN